MFPQQGCTVLCLLAYIRTCMSVCLETKSYWESTSESLSATPKAGKSMSTNLQPPTWNDQVDIVKQLAIETQKMKKSIVKSTSSTEVLGSVLH